MTARDNEKVSDERLIRDLDHAMRTGYIRPMLLTETIEHLRTSQEWVDVRERLPEERVDVLVVECGRYVKQAQRSGQFWYDHEDDVFGVTYWRPFPPPPKGEAP